MTAAMSDMTKRDQEFLATMSDEQRAQWIKDIIDRMMQAWQVDNRKQLARLLGLNDNVPSNWVQNRSVPWSTVYLCAFKTGKSLDWLFDGKAPSAPPKSAEYEAVKNQMMVLLAEAVNMKLIAAPDPSRLAIFAERLADEFATEN